jgi:hypothetical protein
LKGVDITTSSLTFVTPTTRGFNSSGNYRFNQLVDGMDNQAPGLNFSVSSIVGLSELDVDNIELLQGASSALYGSGGMNGTMLMNSKNPFKYQNSYKKLARNECEDKIISSTSSLSTVNFSTSHSPMSATSSAHSPHISPNARSCDSSSHQSNNNSNNNNDKYSRQNQKRKNLTKVNSVDHYSLILLKKKKILLSNPTNLLKKRNL